jgi:hypothetical protein
MRRVWWLVGAYLAIAVMTRVAESFGLHRCGCRPDCWCRRPLLSTFRWVFPFRHAGFDPLEKQREATPPTGPA